MSVSYLSDALRDLLDACWGLAQGAVETTVVMQEEPSEWLWTLKRSGEAAMIDVRVLDGSHSKGRAVVHATTSVLDLAAQVSNEAERLLAEFGEDGYRALWVSDPFPMDSYRRLAEWVANAE